MTRSHLPLVLLIVGAVLAPLIGGQLPIDNLPLSSSPLSSLAGGPEAPMLAHAALGIVPCMALILLLVTRKVQQVPATPFSGLLIVFLGLIAGSSLYSDFKMTSLLVATEWLVAGLALYAVVAGAGRHRGPVAILAGLAGGCALLALVGIAEYGQNKALDPTWRIFATWINPNALAGMLLPGLLVSMALLMTLERVMALAAGAASVAIGVALVLTQSRGAIQIALPVGLIVLVVCALAWNGRASLPRLARVAGVLAALGLLFAALQARPPDRPGAQQSAAVARLAGGGSGAAHSGQFRINLWKGAVEMVRQNPVGTGIGAYRYESARSGLTTQTFFAHQSYLQLAVEASPFALLLFLAIGVSWIVLMCRNARRLPADQNRLRAGVVAAIVAVGAHAMFESNLYHFGILLSTFMLLGLGLLLASDAVAPENVPLFVRRIGAVGAAALAASIAYFGFVDLRKAELRAAIAMRDGARAQALTKSLTAFAPLDQEAWFLAAQSAPTPRERHEALRKAAELGPSTRNLRSLARFELELGNAPRAEHLLRQALTHDPNNLLTLSLLADVYEQQGREADLSSTLRQMIAVEQTPYFQVLAVPEIVPTETYAGRLRLASKERDERARVELLAPAVDGFARYRESTLPMVERMARAGGGASFGSESPERAMEKMRQGAEAARLLAQAYRSIGEADKAADAEREAEAFEAAAAEFVSR